MPSKRTETLIVRLTPELKKLAEEQGREFFSGNPQDHYPDVLDETRLEMKELGWDTGADDEELFEYAMHPEQYRAYKSGDAKKKFEADLAEKKASIVADASVNQGQTSMETQAPKSMVVEVNGSKYKVHITYDESGDSSTEEKTVSAEASTTSNGQSNLASAEITAPIEGNFMLTKDGAENAIKIGDKIEKGDRVCYIESMKVYNTISAHVGGTVLEICAKDGGHVDEDDVLIKLT